MHAYFLAQRVDSLGCTLEQPDKCVSHVRPPVVSPLGPPEAVPPQITSDEFETLLSTTNEAAQQA